MKKSILIVVMIIGIIFICCPFIAKILSNLSNSIDVYKEEIDDMDKKSKDELISKYSKHAINIEEIIGYIEIDKINLSLLIYEGTSDKILSKGVGHLENTGLPINKGDYNCVLAGHTGLTSKTIFDNLYRLKKGDSFSVTILDKKYNYKIFDILKVLPNETQNLEIKNNEKLVTLVTCIPKYINSHRLLVIGRLDF